MLRTGHAPGVPIRRVGGGSPAVSAAFALIDSLYRDEQIRDVLDRHATPRRRAGGDVAVRFPDPVLLTAQLHAELVPRYRLFGRPDRGAHRATPGRSPGMRRLGIALRSEHMSPALLRLRAAARQDFRPRSPLSTAPAVSRGAATSWKGDLRFGSVGWPSRWRRTSVDQSFSGGASPLTAGEALNKVGRPWRVNQGGVLGSGRS